MGSGPIVMAHELVIERKFLKNSKSLAPSGKTGA